MVVKKLSQQQKRAIRNARSLIAAIERRDANEAETRRRVERIFEQLMGYDALGHLSRERAVHGAGETEHVDFAVQIDHRPDAPPAMIVELKRVGLDLSRKHLKQASRYAIDAGCEWVLLTNGRDWQLYHVEFGQPPVTKLVQRWNLLEDEAQELLDKFAVISFKSVKRGLLKHLWETAQVLAPDSLLKAILSRECINALRRVLRRETGVRLKADQIVSGLRKILNESAAAILEDVEVSLPTRKTREVRRRPRASLKELLDVELISPGSVLFADYKGEHHEATVQADGTIMFEGKAYQKPSAAARAVTTKHGVKHVNGWAFWQFEDAAGLTKRLAAVRKEFVARKASEELRPESSGPE